MAGVVGKAIKGFGKALRAHRIKHGKRGKTITGVKPMSGKIPWYVSAGKKDPGERARIVKTHFSLKRSNKIDKAVKDIKEGKKTLKDMEATGQATQLKDYKGKGTGVYHKKGFEN
jgi:predicted transposase YbfD/YdcC